MPINRRATAFVSTTMNWQKRSSMGNPNFPKFKLRPLGNVETTMPQYLQFQRGLDASQIYASISRKEQQEKIGKVLNALADPDRVLQIRWRVSKEVPSFSTDFLFLYLSRFSKVEAVFQQAVNGCVVAFKDAGSVHAVLNKPNLGLPYGRLFAKRWVVLPTDNEMCAVVKYLEEMTSTPSRYNALMLKEYNLALHSQNRACARLISQAFKNQGPSLAPYLANELPYNTYATSTTIRRRQ